jgi:agmatinase
MAVISGSGLPCDRTACIPYYDTRFRAEIYGRDRLEIGVSCKEPYNCFSRADCAQDAEYTFCNRLGGVNTRAIFFPFDLFGNPGARAGAELLADAFEEMLADNRREPIPTRARAYANKVRFEEFLFEKLTDYPEWRSLARERIGAVLAKNEFLLWIAGNHLGVLPLYEELGQSSEPILVVQLDAHLDIYNLGDCTAELSHGNFLLHAAQPMPAIVNVGHRELLLRPDHVGKYYQAVFSAAELAVNGETVLNEVRERCAAATRVYVDLDCDVFDPAYFPAVAQPRPFGLNPQFLLRLFDVIGRDRLSGISISEFDPARDERDRCLETLMWLVEYVLLLKYEK